MAEETKTEQQTAQSQQAQAGETAKESEAAKETGEERIDPQQYKDLQAKLEAKGLALTEAERTLELVQDFVDWDAVQGKKAPTGEAGGVDDTDGYVSKKELEARDRRVQGQLLAMQFRADHPDLKEYESRLVTPTVVRLIQEHPRWPREKVIEQAAKETREFLKAEHDKAKEEAQAEADKKRKEAAGAGGFGSAGSTSPKKEEGGQTNKDYLAEREAQLAKMKSPI